MPETTPENFFGKFLPSLFKPDKAKGWNRVVQVTLEDDGEWILEIKNQKLTIREGVTKRPDLEVESDFETFSGLYTGKIFAPDAARAGKLNTIGPMSDFLKFSRVFKVQK